jgi:hypothetical protein
MTSSTMLLDQVWVGGLRRAFSARLLVVFASCLVGAACASRGDVVRVVIPPQNDLDLWIGRPASEVKDRFGRPTATRPSPDGGHLLIYERIGRGIPWQPPSFNVFGHQGIIDAVPGQAPAGAGGTALAPAIVPADGVVSEILAQFWIGSDDRVVRVEVHPRKFRRHLGRVRTLE